jgi:murein DD-endopeptidase MepM/ murein hydrolase activator NlpD
MSNGIAMIAAGLWGQLFPERQLYLRSNGRVRYLCLPPVTQLIGVILFLSVFSWMSYASVNFAFLQGAQAGPDSRYEELRFSYERLAAELAQVQNRLPPANQEVKSGQAEPAALPKLVNKETISISPTHEPIVAQNAVQNNALPMPRPRPQILANDSARVQQDIRPRPRPMRAVLRLPNSMTSVQNGGLDYGQRYGMQPLSDYPGARTEVLTHLAGDAGTAITVIERLISQTGLDADTMLRRQGVARAGDGSGAGGPLLTLPPSMTAKFLRRNAPGELAVPETRRGRLEMLKEALFSLPLAEPVDKYYVSSGYGYRRDPFTRVKAFHSGMDLVAPHGDAVRSSAPGIVVFAGRNGPYGNMVEVDHGRGVKSRYGHLSRISVKLGQKVGLRDTIGLVGNTGRSGTAHLHFEVWFDGKARDPRNFLKAGENVFQRQG